MAPLVQLAWDGGDTSYLPSLLLANSDMKEMLLPVPPAHFAFCLVFDPAMSDMHLYTHRCVCILLDACFTGGK